MTQPSDETPDYLAKPVSPSGERPPEPPPATAPYGSPYAQQPYAEQPPAYQPFVPYGQPGAYPFAQAHGGANVAMGLGITSVVCAVLTPFICITMPGFLTGPFAIALAVRARREMAASPGAYNNGGAATAGLVTGIIGTVLGLLMTALVLFFVGAVVGFA